MMSYVRNIFVFCFAIALAACSSSGNNVEDGKVLNRATSSEPSTLDPHLALGNASSVIIDDLFMGLMTTDKDGDETYGLAKSHTVDESGTLYTFTLRENLKWSDGAPITSEDVVYTLRRLMTPETAARYAGNLYFIKNAFEVNTGKLDASELGVKALDERTVSIELNQRVPFFLKVLSANALVILPRQAIEEHGLSWTRPGKIVVNGSYILTDWIPNTQIVLRKNDKFWDKDNTAIDTVRFYPTDDVGTAFKRFRAGELDIILGFPPDQIDLIKERYSEELNISPNLGLFYWVINTQKKPFDEIKVRKALSISIDRDVITQKLLKGFVSSAWGIVPPASANYDPKVPDIANVNIADRQAMARELLKEAGYSESNPLNVELRYDSKEQTREISVAVASMWRDIGVVTDLQASDFRGITSDIRKGDFDVIRYQWYAPYDDPTTFLNLVKGGSRTNYSKYKNDAYDAMLIKADEQPDVESRSKMLSEAEALILEDYAVIPIFYAKANRMVTKKVKGWKNTPGGNIPSRYLDVSE